VWTRCLEGAVCWISTERCESRTALMSMAVAGRWWLNLNDSVFPRSRRVAKLPNREFEFPGLRSRLVLQPLSAQHSVHRPGRLEDDLHPFYILNPPPSLRAHRYLRGTLGRKDDSFVLPVHTSECTCNLIFDVSLFLSVSAPAGGNQREKDRERAAKKAAAGQNKTKESASSLAKRKES
jgi:hypothetical protein